MKSMSVFRIYVEKKPEFAVEAQSLLSDIRTALRLDITSIRVINRYDADKITKEDFQLSVSTVFSEPAVDVTYDTLPRLANTGGFLRWNICRVSLTSVRIPVSSASRF